MSKKKKKIRPPVKKFPVRSDKEVIEVLTSEEPARNRPECCGNCGSRSSSLKKHGKEYWCIPCIKGETEEK